MTQLDYARAAAIGAIQGLTEFLPISSSGHLAVVQRWIGLDPVSGDMLLLDVLVHLATLVAVGVVFAVPARRFARRLAREASRSGTTQCYAWHLIGYAALATLVTGSLGLIFQDAFESAFDEPALLGACFIVTGGLLAATAPRRRRVHGWKELRWWQAALVGFAQAVAILPGISRSGSTIAVALFFGLRRRWAAEFSFLIAVPAIIGGAAIKIKDTIQLPQAQLVDIPWGPILLATLVSAAVGVVALSILLNVVRRAKLHLFAWYCWLVGTLILTGIL